MKKSLTIIALAVASFSSFAVESTTSTAGPATAAQQTLVNSTGQAQSNNAGNSQNITFTSPATSSSIVSSSSTVSGDTTSRIIQSGEVTQNVNYGSQTIRNTPSVAGPPLVSSNDTCMGSGSGGVNVPGFGLSLGKTYTDSNCVMLKNSRELWNMGMKGAAMALMCTDSANREALELTGFECPQTTRDKQKQAAAADRADSKDQIVRGYN